MSESTKVMIIDTPYGKSWLTAAIIEKLKELEEHVEIVQKRESIEPRINIWFDEAEKTPQFSLEEMIAHVAIRPMPEYDVDMRLFEKKQKGPAKPYFRRERW